MIKNKYELRLLLKSKLKQEHWNFNQYGYPIFPREVLLSEIPSVMEPLQNIRTCKHPSETLLCSFTKDKFINPRLERIFDEVSLYKKFMGLGEFDLSPRLSDDLKIQKTNILLSQLATAFIASKGVKIIPNFRIGNLSTLFTLESYPKNIPFVVGTLGCSKRYGQIHEEIFVAKCLKQRPSFLIIYGSLSKHYAKLLNDLGMSYVVLDDFRKISYRNSMKMAG